MAMWVTALLYYSFSPVWSGVWQGEVSNRMAHVLTPTYQGSSQCYWNTMTVFINIKNESWLLTFIQNTGLPALTTHSYCKQHTWRALPAWNILKHTVIKLFFLFTGMQCGSSTMLYITMGWYLRWYCPEELLTVCGKETAVGSAGMQLRITPANLLPNPESMVLLKFGTFHHWMCNFKWLAMLVTANFQKSVEKLAVDRASQIRSIAGNW